MKSSSPPPAAIRGALSLTSKATSGKVGCRSVGTLTARSGEDGDDMAVDAMQEIEALVAFEGRWPGTDAERRAAGHLERRLDRARTRGRGRAHRRLPELPDHARDPRAARDRRQRPLGVHARHRRGARPVRDRLGVRRPLRHVLPRPPPHRPARLAERHLEGGRRQARRPGAHRPLRRRAHRHRVRPQGRRAARHVRQADPPRVRAVRALLLVALPDPGVHRAAADRVRGHARSPSSSSSPPSC